MTKMTLNEMQLKVAEDLVGQPDGTHTNHVAERLGCGKTTAYEIVRFFVNCNVVERVDMGGMFHAKFKPLPKLLDVVTSGELEVPDGVTLRGKPPASKPVHKPEPKKERTPTPAPIDDNSAQARLRRVVEVLDEAGIKKKDSAGNPVLIEDRVQVLIDQRDEATEKAGKLEKKMAISLDPKLFEKILRKLNTPAVRLFLGREPKPEDLLDRVIAMGISTLESELK